jgi:hypothetical protein
VVQLDVSHKEDWMKVKEYIQAHLPATATGRNSKKDWLRERGKIQAPLPATSSGRNSKKE